MDEHGIAAILEHVFASFERIKTISGSAEIDRIAVNGMADIKNAVDGLGITNEFRTVRDRRIDPTM